MTGLNDFVSYYNSTLVKVEDHLSQLAVGLRNSDRNPKTLAYQLAQEGLEEFKEACIKRHLNPEESGLWIKMAEMELLSPRKFQATLESIIKGEVNPELHQDT